jgi:hypothetical protein
MEVSFDVETESFIEFTFLWLSLPLINIHDIPLLVDLAMSLVDNDVLVLSIYTSLDVKYLIILNVSNESSIKSEQLPPS